MNAENKDITVVDISGFEAGLYIVDIINENEKKVHSKIVKI